ncbi:ribbon-helix-helix domain-containing protein [Anoxybacillus sp. TBDG-1]
MQMPETDTPLEIISDILERVNGGTKTAVLCKEIGVGEKRLREGLKNAGYEYSQRTKRWEYVGTSPEPLERSIFDFIQNARENIKPVNKTAEKGNMKAPSKPNNNVNSSGVFSAEEIAILKEMIANYKGRSSTPANDTKPLYERIMSLDTSEPRKRKTIIIRDSIAKQLDNFAEQTRFNKSDIIELAILDFIRKYEKGEDNEGIWKGNRNNV